jgi:hypothetical protein
MTQKGTGGFESPAPTTSRCELTGRSPQSCVVRVNIESLRFQFPGLVGEEEADRVGLPLLDCTEQFARRLASASP